MENQFTRTEMLFGPAAVKRLAAARVAVFGVGGVGGHVVEVLARSGVGELTLVDNDRVGITNINRQIIATLSTLGRLKVDVAEERIHDINPGCAVRTHAMFYLPENADGIDLTQFDYVVDCIDTVTAKLELVRRCRAAGTPLLSCMGAANKLDPTAFRVADINETKIDPLAKIIRKKLRKLGIDRLQVVYSEEEPRQPFGESPALAPDGDNVPAAAAPRRRTPASNAFVPAAAGLVASGHVVKELITDLL
nr:tRNA threonylcarbamoyladenosine dehydratase [uncultured Prevotella sp.]